MEQPAQQSAQQADPKMLRLYQGMALAAMKIIYDPQESKGIVETMRIAGDPAAAIAHAADIVIAKIRRDAGAKGIPPAMVNSVAPAVVAMLCDLGHAAGLFKVDENLVKTAVELVKQGEQQAPAAQAAPAAPPKPGLIGSAMPAPATVQ